MASRTVLTWESCTDHLSTPLTGQTGGKLCFSWAATISPLSSGQIQHNSVGLFKLGSCFWYRLQPLQTNGLPRHLLRFNGTCLNPTGACLFNRCLTYKAACGTMGGAAMSSIIFNACRLREILVKLKLFKPC